MDWNVVGSALFGGFISLVSSLIVFRVTTKEEAKRRRDEGLAAQANNAFLAFNLLSRALNAIASIQTGIDECMEDAEKLGTAEVPIGIRITPLHGCPSEVSELSPSHIAFLLNAKRSALFNKCVEYIVSVNFTLSHLARFNEKRIDLQKNFHQLVHAGANLALDESKLVGTAILDRPAGILHRAEVAVLNELAEKLISTVAKQLAEGKSLVIGLHGESVTAFGELYPASTIKVNV